MDMCFLLYLLQILCLQAPLSRQHHTYFYYLHLWLSGPKLPAISSSTLTLSLLSAADAASSAVVQKAAESVLFQRCLPNLNGFPLSNGKGFFQTVHGLIFFKGKVMQILSNGRRIKWLSWPSWWRAAPTELVSSGFSLVIDSTKISSGI